MRNCRTCKPPQQPVLINGEYGMHYQCPKCSVRTTAWSDERTAAEDWDALHDGAMVSPKGVYPEPHTPRPAIWAPE